LPNPCWFALQGVFEPLPLADWPLCCFRGQNGSQHGCTKHAVRPRYRFGARILACIHSLPRSSVEGAHWRQLPDPSGNQTTFGPYLNRYATDKAGLRLQPHATRPRCLLSKVVPTGLPCRRPAQRVTVLSPSTHPMACPLLFEHRYDLVSDRSGAYEHGWSVEVGQRSLLGSVSINYRWRHSH